MFHLRLTTVFFQQDGEVNNEDEKNKPRFVGSLSNPSVKTLPSHIGPKIRHKNPKISRKALQKQEKDQKNRKRLAREMYEQVSEAPEPKKIRKLEPKPKSQKKLKKHRQEAQDEQKFNTLVANYKSRLLASENVQKKSKWFD